MAISRVTTWASQQSLTAAALNAEFDNIINNALSLVSPWTADMAAGGFRLTGLDLGIAASPSLSFTGDTNNGFFSPGADRFSIATAGTARMEIAALGAVFINGTSDADMTIGLCINQAANNDAIFSLKSSDIAHGMTTLGETDTYASFRKQSATGGGMEIRGFTEFSVGWLVAGLVTTEDATRSTAGLGAVYLAGAVKSGTTATTMTGDRNVLVVASGSNTRFILDSDGDSHQDVGTAWTNFDDEDDVELLNLLSAHVTRKEDPLRASFGHWLAEDRDILEQMGVVSFNDAPGEDGHAFMNMSRLTMLHTGAIRQLGAKLNRCERALAAAGLALPE